MLPTPRTSDQNGAGHHGQGGMDLRTVASLLPTPRARVDKEHGPNGKHWGELRPTVEALLPTPKTTDAAHAAATEYELGRAPGLDQLHVRLARTASTGAPTDKPSSDGKPSSDEKPRLRLSPEFPAWMLGLPHGWLDPNCRQSVMGSKFRSRSWWGE